ncbi:MAG: aldehyde ferredoxin oxidoreductase family protein [Actinobacteria bacterium]|nr:aldehyde ferredoxin oxidoreductase family protein [Actinomycetota bacterium]
MMGGNWGRILEVDVSKGTTQDLEPDERLYRDYLGGSGLAAKLFFDRRGWEAEPLSPENPLIIMLGPLSGLNLPGVARLEICARSPLTGIWGEACMGGHFAPQLKRTGYDGIVVTGASEKPVYLYVTDEGAEIRDASHLWGRDTYETEEALKDEVGDKRAQAMCIGPAGENLVKYANVMNDRGSTAGRCGMGAVMGSKKLKAVVARGGKKAPIADEGAYKAAREHLNEVLRFSMIGESFGTYGTNVGMDFGMAIGDAPTKNWREAYWEGGPEKLGGVAVAESILTRTHSCYGCPIGCKRIVKVDAGPFAMEEGPGSEYEAAAALGTMQRMDSVEANNKANEMCNRYGMDSISTGGTIAYATEAFEEGLIVESDTGGIKLGWNQPETLLLLIDKIAQREGFGDELAEGVRSMAEKYGGDDFAIHVKGLECPMHDPRALWGLALTYATSVRGACHVADANLFADYGMTDHKDLGVKRSWPYKAKGKAAQTVASQEKGSVADSAIICLIAWASEGGAMKDMVEMLNPVTGFEYDVDELVRVGDRIWYLKRAIGNLCGAKREDDQLPRRIIEPHVEGTTSYLTMAAFPTMMSMLPMGKLRVEKLRDVLADFQMKILVPKMDKLLRLQGNLPGLRGHAKRLEAGEAEEIRRRTVPFDDMLQEFYQLRDIDGQGRPSRKVLERLGMTEVADALHG